MVFLAFKPLLYKPIFFKDENFTIFGLHPLLGLQEKFQACLEIKANSTSLKLNRVSILPSLSFEFDVLLGFLNP